jgi:hypothetical protein
MKLKFFMRGLGIGIILATLIFTLSNTKEKLSDQEIMNRATELGMVTEEESDRELNQLLENINPTVTVEPSAAPTDTPTAVPTQAATVTPTPAPTAVPTVTPVPAVTKVPTVTNVPEKADTPTKAPEQQIGDTTQTDTSDNSQGTGEEISFTIKSGMSSGQVALLLVEKGLIEDEDDFNKYIEASGKASVIRVGTYSLPKGSTYKEIVTKITTKQ